MLSAGTEYCRRERRGLFTTGFKICDCTADKKFYLIDG
jgi:hypothetical protein